MRNFLLLVAYSTLLAPPRLYAQGADAADIYVAAVSYVRDHVRAYEGGPVVACVAVSPPRYFNGRPSPTAPGVDLDSTALERIPKGRIPVRPGSACYISATRGSARLDVDTGRHAVVIVVATPEINGDRAHLLAQLTINGRSGRGFSCSMIRRDEKWSVDSCAPTWIS